jgi:hypothetical protein
MALSAFDDKAAAPGGDELTKTLGRTGRLWDELVTTLASEFEPLDETWTYSGKSWGWSLRLKRKKRTVLYLTPCRGHFLAGFALGEKAVQAAHDGGLPAETLRTIDTATKYAEGRAVRIEVRNKKDVGVVEKLAAIKMAN